MDLDPHQPDNNFTNMAWQPWCTLEKEIIFQTSSLFDLPLLVLGEKLPGLLFQDPVEVPEAQAQWLAGFQKPEIQAYDIILCNIVL